MSKGKKSSDVDIVLQFLTKVRKEIYMQKEKAYWFVKITVLTHETFGVLFSKTVRSACKTLSIPCKNTA